VDKVKDYSFEDSIRSAEQSPEYWVEVALLEFVHSLSKIMLARGEVSKKKLADLVGVKPPTLSRWLNGNENLTVSTMCRLAFALGAAVHIHVADQHDMGRWRVEIGETEVYQAAQEAIIRPRTTGGHMHPSTFATNAYGVASRTRTYTNSH